jgi:transcriptional regulator with XRE-family HTH domain
MPRKHREPGPDAKALRQLRVSRGHTQRYVADLLGVHIRTINAWEAGDQAVDRRALAEYARDDAADPA